MSTRVFPTLHELLNFLSTNQTANLRALYKTEGYYTPGDEGGNTYRVEIFNRRAPAPKFDNGSLIRFTRFFEIRPVFDYALRALFPGNKVTYQQFGARADGVSNVTAVILQTHEIANTSNLIININGSFNASPSLLQAAPVVKFTVSDDAIIAGTNATAVLSSANNTQVVDTVVTNSISANRDTYEIVTSSDTNLSIDKVVSILRPTGSGSYTYTIPDPSISLTDDQVIGHKKLVFNQSNNDHVIRYSNKNATLFSNSAIQFLYTGRAFGWE
jgi:hypothetical protein